MKRLLSLFMSTLMLISTFSFFGIVSFAEEKYQIENAYFQERCSIVDGKNYTYDFDITFYDTELEENIILHKGVDYEIGGWYPMTEDEYLEVIFSDDEFDNYVFPEMPEEFGKDYCLKVIGIGKFEGCSYRFIEGWNPEFNSGHEAVTIPGVPATCQNTGLTDGSKCSLCGKILEEQKVIEKTEHTPQVVPAVAPTCTETGLTEGSKCSVCQEVLVPQKTIDAMDHIWDMGDITTAPTCEKDGEKTYHCIVCLATRTEPIDMTVHKLKTTTTAATYAKAGKQETKCTACGKVTNTKVLPKLTVPATTLSKVTTPKSKQLKVTWKKNTKVTGYEVQYSTDKNFKKSAKKVTIKKNKTTSTTIKKLKSKKKYYVRIRTYKTVNGKKYYSAWSKSKNVKVK